MTIEEQLVQFIVDTRYDDLPDAAIDYARKSILDTIGAAVAGATEPGCTRVVELVRSWGGAAQSSIWLHGGKVPAHLAALANAPMARTKELGDFHKEAGGVHASEYIVPAVLALAEARGGVSGRDLIAAVAVGQDVMCRLGIAVGEPAPVTGRLAITRILGPAAACAKVLALDKTQTHDALGIAYSGGLCSIDMQQYIDGSMTSFVHYGFCAEGAIKAVQLAQAGVRGTRNFLMGRWGYFERIERKHADLDAITRDLGVRFEGANITTKPYPSCGCTHSSINAVADLVAEHRINHAAIREIDIAMVDGDYQMAYLPAEVRYDPPNEVSARMSGPYTVAAAAVKGGVSLDDFTAEAMRSPAVRQVMAKVRGRVEPGLGARLGDEGPQGPVVATIHMADGRAFEKLIAKCKGDPSRPMSFDEVAEEKFRKYLAFSIGPIASGRAEDIVDLVRRLEQVQDVGEISRRLGSLVG